MHKPLYEKKIYGQHNNRVIFLLGGWQSYQWMMWPASKLLERSGFMCITYTFDHKILTPNIRKSILQAGVVKNDILRQIRLFRRKGFKDFSIFGNSLGALISLLVAKDSAHIKKVIFNTPGIDVAESLWKWDEIFPEFKQELVKRYPSLQALKKELAPIDPAKNLTGISNKDVLVYISAKDEIVASSERRTRKILEANNARFKLIVNRNFGHVMTLIFNLINAPEYLRFLNNTQSQKLP
jgi:hypothetical protein